jgi:hypothetical protein
MSPRRGSTPRLTDRLTVGRNATLTLTLIAFVFLYQTLLGFSDSNKWYGIFRTKTLDCQVEKNEHLPRFLLYEFS